MLTLEELIMESHDDFDIVSSVLTGFDDAMDFIIELRHTDYQKPEHSFKLTASMDKEKAFILSRTLNIPLTRLPKTLSDKFEDKSGFLFPSQVEHTFRDVLDFITAHGGRFKTRKTRLT